MVVSEAHRHSKRHARTGTSVTRVHASVSKASTRTASYGAVWWRKCEAPVLLFGSTALTQILNFHECRFSSHLERGTAVSSSLACAPTRRPSPTGMPAATASNPQRARENPPSRCSNMLCVNAAAVLVWLHRFKHETGIGPHNTPLERHVLELGAADTAE
jgi:hypothetical protein